MLPSIDAGEKEKGKGGFFISFSLQKQVLGALMCLKSVVFPMEDLCLKHSFKMVVEPLQVIVQLPRLWRKLARAAFQMLTPGSDKDQIWPKNDCLGRTWLCLTPDHQGVLDYAVRSQFSTKPISIQHSVFNSLGCLSVSSESKSESDCTAGSLLWGCWGTFSRVGRQNENTCYNPHNCVFFPFCSFSPPGCVILSGELFKCDA